MKCLSEFFQQYHCSCCKISLSETDVNRFRNNNMFPFVMKYRLVAYIGVIEFFKFVQKGCFCCTFITNRHQLELSRNIHYNFHYHVINLSFKKWSHKINNSLITAISVPHPLYLSVNFKMIILKQSVMVLIYIHFLIA